MNKSAGLLFCLLISASGFALAGTHKPVKINKHHKVSDADSLQKITVQAVAEIKYQATSAVQTLEGILNSIAFNDNTPSETAGYITNSYTPNQRSRVFTSNTIIIESDLDPKFTQGAGKNKDLQADKYLNDFDLAYEKTADFSIKFTNLEVSNPKKTDHIYVRVKFTSAFGSKYKSTGEVYPARQREALVRMEPQGKKHWTALIEGLSYFDPAVPIDSKDHDMEVVSSDTAANSAGTVAKITQEDINRETLKVLQEQEALKKKDAAQFDVFVAAGDNYRKTRQFAEAMESYKKAETINPLSPPLEKKILETKKLLEQNTPEYWKVRGDKAALDRDFKNAIKDYNTAISLKPSESATLQPKVTEWSKIVATISKPQAMLDNGEYDNALQECEIVLKAEKKADKTLPTKFPELYLIEGKAYQKKAEAKADDSYNDKALTNYTKAIDNFTNYKAAHLARENFYENIKPNLGLAINDYEALITNELDDSPEKAIYVAAKGKLKDKQRGTDWPKSSIADYNVAISLSRGIATIKDTVLGKRDAQFYFIKGELQYRTDMNAEAAISLDSAVIINPKFANALFFRGMNFVKLNNYASAGVDFAKAEANSLDPVHTATVDSLSFEFFRKGRELSAKHDFASADSSYDNSLKIRPCNSNSIHGKAEMRLITANELFAKKDTANGILKYKESIELNTQALGCKKTFSDADYKAGVAHRQLKEYDQAITNFTQAFKNDDKNIQAIVERGKTYQIQQKYSKAIDDFNIAIKLSNDLFEVVRKGNDRARLLVVTDSLSTAYQLKGKAQYSNKDYTGAIETLGLSLNQAPVNYEALYYSGLVYLNQPQRDLSRATRYFDDAIKNKPDYRFYYANGLANYYNKNYLVSINHFSDAIRLDSGNEARNKYYMRGLAYFKNKDNANALADFDAYNKYSYAKNDTSFFADYGVTQLLSGQDTAAFKTLSYALSKSKTNAMALYGVGCYYAKTNEPYKALDSFKSAFSTHQLTKDFVKQMEEALLQEFLADKSNKSNYKKMKSDGFSSN